jgi:hypothetical protein
MKGLVQHLLLNPAGEPLSSFQSDVSLFIDEDTKQHDTFFIGYSALISSEDVLMILIREFEEAPNDMRHVIRMKLECPFLTLFNC